MEKTLNSRRASLRQAIPAIVDRIWREAQSAPQQSTPFKATAEGEAFDQRVQELQPSNASTRNQGEAQFRSQQIWRKRDFYSSVSWQLDTCSLFGSPSALDDSFVRWLLSYGACQRDHLGVARHLCTVSLRGAFPYSGTRPTVLRHYGDPKRTSSERFARSQPLDRSQRCQNVSYGSEADIVGLPTSVRYVPLADIAQAGLRKRPLNR